MKRWGSILSLLLCLFSTKSIAAETSTYDAVVDGMSCSQSSPGQLNCYYNIGNDLIIVIAGVGDNDAGISIYKSSGLDGDFFPSFGISHNCIIVKPGKKIVVPGKNPGRIFDYAYISPKTGKVYQTLQECGQAR